MTMDPKPDNQPDPSDMSAPTDKDGENNNPATLHPHREEAEEEAARLGDFA